MLVKQQYGKHYTFDRIFGPTAKQVDIYETIVKPLIPELLAGYNCTVFAYGQTGTGKTYTISGGSVTTGIPLEGVSFVQHFFFCFISNMQKFKLFEE